MLSQITSQFSPIELWNPVFLLGTCVVAVFYLLLVGPFARHIPHASPVPLRKKVFFLAGLFAFYMGYAGPFFILSHIMFSSHMFQMAFLYFIVPPLLLLGSPSWFFKPLLEKPVIRLLSRILLQPLVAILMFNLLLSLYHLPGVFDYLMTHYTPHRLYQLVTFFMASCMWWNLVSPVAEYNRMSELKKIGYVFANSALLLPACTLIIFADHNIYNTYADPNSWAYMLSLCLPPNTTVPPELFDSLRLIPILEDQQFGGIVMKLTQEMVFVIVLITVFYQWVQREKKVVDINDYQRTITHTQSIPKI